jgi:predicted glycosyltransferase
VEELAWLTKPPNRTPESLKELENKEHIILFRNVEYKASYFRNVKVNTWQLLDELSKISTVIYIPRYSEEEEKLKDLENVWVPPKTMLTFQAIPYADAVVGSGGTICRESALMGVPTVNFHFWDAVAKYLCRKGFPIQYSANINKILSTVKKIIKNPKKHRLKTTKMLAKMENPTEVTVKYIEKCLKPN